MSGGREPALLPAASQLHVRDEMVLKLAEQLALNGAGKLLGAPHAAGGRFSSLEKERTNIKII